LKTDSQEVARILPLSFTKRSELWSFPGDPTSSCYILAGNGVGNSIADARQNADYIRSLSPVIPNMQWVYNKTNTVAVDVLEAFFNISTGISPNTAKLYRESLTTFHLLHFDNPRKKMLILVHSQATIHLLNALVHLPREIQLRAYVVAIAPAVVVPKEICYRSFNYASRDPIPYLEMIVRGFFNSNETGNSLGLQRAMEYQDQLIRLAPHPDAPWIDHEFQSLTYQPEIKYHLKNHFTKNGEYP
jgi:hypothetical protein